LITNLVDNAIRFTQPGGSATIGVESFGAEGPLPTAILSVIDTGIGIPAEHLPHIFDRFYQVDAARASGGCGLGLSLCRWIVMAHGGTIEARSAPGEGTVFTVRLPMAPVVPARPEATSFGADGGA
jgi:two-component system sensor histidine kinase BaeS